MAKSGKTGTYIFIALSALFIATFVILVAVRVFLPKMIVNKAEKTNKVEQITSTLNELNFNYDKAIQAVEDMKVSNIKIALNAIEDFETMSDAEITNTFIYNLNLEGIDPAIILKSMKNKDENFKEAAGLIRNLNKNTNKLHLTLPIIKDTIIEVLKRSKNSNT